MDRKTYEHLEDAHLAKLRQFDEAEWDLYDLKNGNKRTWDEGQMMIQDIQIQNPEINFNNFMFDLEERFDRFHKQVLQKGSDLEELRYQEKQDFMKKTESYKPSSFW